GRRARGLRRTGRESGERDGNDKNAANKSHRTSFFWVKNCQSPEDNERHNALDMEVCRAVLEAKQDKTKRRPEAASCLRKLLGLESTNALCLPVFLSFGHSEFNRLAVLQAAVPV